MEHSFNVELAKKYGIEESILISHLFFWIKKNVANEKHHYDGRYWTYSSAKALCVVFPYMSEAKIYRILNSLEILNIIIKGKYNEDKYVHTKWYAFTDNILPVLRDCGFDVDNFSDLLTKSSNQNNEIVKSNIINSKDIVEDKKEIDKSISQKDELFEKCWVAYNRKGAKRQAKQYWYKLTDNEKESVLTHIKAYVSSRDKQYQKDFERYLRDKVFLTVVFKANQVIYDPTKLGKSDSTANVYTPSGNFSIAWDDAYDSYVYIGYYYDGMELADGYDANNRPDGAKIVLNNARGTIVWNSEIKKWIKL